VVAYGKDPEKMRVYEIMTKPCIVVNPDLGVEYVARLFANTGIRVAPIVKDELVGIVSVTDILNKGDFVEKPKVNILQRELDIAISEAKSICAAKGVRSQECIDAWELVEDIEADANYQSETYPTVRGRPKKSEIKPLETTELELFCWEYPDMQEVLQNPAKI